MSQDVTESRETLCLWRGGDVRPAWAIVAALVAATGARLLPRVSDRKGMAGRESSGSSVHGAECRSYGNGSAMHV
jgi:hypothetical protein